MTGVTRRSLNTGLAALAAAGLGGRGARADVAAVSKTLPRKHAGTTLRMMAGNDPVSMALAQYASEFAEATGSGSNSTTRARTTATKRWCST